MRARPGPHRHRRRPVDVRGARQALAGQGAALLRRRRRLQQVQVLRRDGAPVLRESAGLGYMQRDVHKRHGPHGRGQHAVDLQGVGPPHTRRGRLGVEGLCGAGDELPRQTLLRRAWRALLRKKRLLGRVLEDLHRAVDVQEPRNAHTVARRAAAGRAPVGQVGGEGVLGRREGLPQDEVLQRSREHLLPEERIPCRLPRLVHAGPRPLRLRCQGVVVPPDRPEDAGLRTLRPLARGQGDGSVG
mmetsp:Transcript_118517/g.340312  ORF Transcript_118517/g.340312 Transcript_118517/m.340312 type:complete len:244 (+) Transcript_118517:424-1155(+)